MCAQRFAVRKEEDVKRNPFFDVLGAQLEVWEGGYVEICLPVSPDFLNSAGVLHGGMTA